MNEVILSGRITAKPDLKVKGDVKIAKFTIAANRGKNTQFVNVVAFGNVAENVYKYTDKGSIVTASGYIDTTPYEHDGKRVYPTSVVIAQIEFLSSAAKALDDEAEKDKNISKKDATFVESENMNIEYDDIDMTDELEDNL